MEALEKLVVELESTALTSAVINAKQGAALVHKQNTIDTLNEHCDELVDKLADKETLIELAAKLRAAGITAVELAVSMGELDDWDEDDDDEDDEEDDDDWDDID